MQGMGGSPILGVNNMLCQLGIVLIAIFLREGFDATVKIGSRVFSDCRSELVKSVNGGFYGVQSLRWCTFYLLDAF